MFRGRQEQTFAYCVIQSDSLRLMAHGHVSLKTPANRTADHLETAVVCLVNDPITLVCLTMSEAKAYSCSHIILS